MCNRDICAEFREIASHETENRTTLQAYVHGKRFAVLNEGLSVVSSLADPFEQRSLVKDGAFLSPH